MEQPPNSRLSQEKIEDEEVGGRGTVFQDKNEERV